MEENMTNILKTRAMQQIYAFSLIPKGGKKCTTLYVEWVKQILVEYEKHLS